MSLRRQRRIILLLLALLIFLLVAIAVVTQGLDPNGLLNLSATFDSGFGGTQAPAGTPLGTPMANVTAFPTVTP